MDNLNYIYLLQEREFVKCNENIYKVGKTKKDQFTRFNQYPNGSILLLQIKCNDCDCNEREIIKLFKSKYTHKKQIGHEYFEGDYEDMMKNIFNIVLKNNGKKGSYCVNDVVDDVVDEVVKVAKPVVVKVVKPKAIKSKNPTASIKHPHTAFSFFTQQQRPICQKAHPEATFGQLSRFVSEGWKALTPKQMNIYKSLETDDKARYQVERDVVLAKVAADNAKTIVSKVITPKAIKAEPVVDIIYNQSIPKSKKGLENYLNDLTVKKLHTICKYFMISYSGNKKKIIEKIIKQKQKHNMLDEIVNSNKYEYLITCFGINHEFGVNREISVNDHLFFSNIGYHSYNNGNPIKFKCETCKCKTNMNYCYNEFYDTSI